MFCKKKESEINKATYIKVYTGFYLMEKWIKVRQRGKSLKQFFEDNCIKEIAIYGMAEIGQLLMLELKETSVNVKCGIDRNAKDKEHLGIKVVDFYDVEEYKDLPAIVVTPTQYFDDIRRQLKEQTDAFIINLEDIVNYCIEEV